MKRAIALVVAGIFYSGLSFNERVVLAAEGTNVFALPKEVELGKDAGHGQEIFLSVRLGNGQVLPLAMDTGASWTVFDKSVEPLLGQRLHTGTVFRWGVESESGIYLAPPLFLGGTRLKMSGPYVATDDFKSISAAAGRPILGLLGMDVLENYCIQIDFERGRLRFLDAEKADKKKWGKAFPLTNIGDGCLALRENLAGVKGVGSLLDTGCNYDGWLVPGVYAQWTNEMQLPAEGEAKCPYGVLGGEKHRLTQLRGLDPKLMASGDTHVQMNGVGLRYLSHYVVTFDFPNRTMYLKRPSAWSVIF